MGEKHVGFGKETTYGTAVAATLWLELLSEGVRREPSYQPVPSIRSVAARALSLGKVVTRGPFRLVGNYQDLPSLFWYWFGEETVTGPGPYVHTIPDASPLFIRPSFTYEAQRDVGDGGDTFKYAGCMLTELAVTVAVEELFEASGALIGNGVETTGSPSTPSYPAFDLMMPTECVVKIDTVEKAVERFSLNLAWPLDEPGKLGSTALARKPREASNMTVRGSFTLLEHDAAGAFTKFGAYTDAAIQLVASAAGAAPEELTINVNKVKILQATPALDGRATPKPVVEFEARLDETISSPFNVVATNDKATLP